MTTVLLVYCQDTGVARRYRDLFAAEELGLLLRPYIFTPNDVPLVIDVPTAQANPALAVLSAICHGDTIHIDAAFPALVAALRMLGNEQAILYYDVVLAGLPEAARTRWEAFMTNAVDYEFRSELLRMNFAQGRELGKEVGIELGKELGEALGEAMAVVKLLRGRGVPVSEEIEAQILGCTDHEKLDGWILRAATATNAAEILH